LHEAGFVPAERKAKRELIDTLWRASVSALSAGTGEARERSWGEIPGKALARMP